MRTFVPWILAGIFALVMIGARIMTPRTWNSALARPPRWVSAIHFVGLAGLIATFIWSIVAISWWACVPVAAIYSSIYLVPSLDPRRWDRKVERRAVDTIFFSDRTYWGKTYRVCDVHYPAFEFLSSSPVFDPLPDGSVRRGRIIDCAEAVADLKRLLEAHADTRIETDICLLFTSQSWRWHLIACAAMLLGHTSPSVLDAAWRCLRRGGGATPQIAATCRMRDPEFLLRAEEAVKDPAAAPYAVQVLEALSEGALHLDSTQESRLAAARLGNEYTAVWMRQGREDALQWREHATRVFG